MSTQFELTSDSTTEGLQQEALYLIDFSKLKDVNDLILILSSLGLTMSSKHPFFEQVKKFLVLDQPIDPKTGNLIKK